MELPSVLHPLVRPVVLSRTLLVASALACVIAAAWLVLLLVTGPDLPPRAPLAVPQAPASTSPASGDTDWGLFGTADAVDYGLSGPVEATPLALRLRGAVTGERGYAIIVDANGNEAVYRVDDELPGGARVLEIEQRRVLLRRQGRTEALELPGGEGGGRMSRAPTAVARNGDSGASSAVTGLGIGSFAAQASRYALDPDELARQITILPVAGGGFRVRAGRDAALFTALGFEANDIVTAINGQPVSTQADVRGVFENYNPGERIAISVRRGDRQLVLTPDLGNP